MSSSAMARLRTDVEDFLVTMRHALNLASIAQPKNPDAAARYVLGALADMRQVVARLRESTDPQ